MLLLDISGSLQPVIDKVADEGMQALAQLRPNDDMAVVTFGKWATVSQKFTRDRQQVIKSMGFIKDMGEWIRAGTNFNEGIYTAAEYMNQSANPNSRRVIIVVLWAGNRKGTQKPKGTPGFHSPTQGSAV